MPREPSTRCRLPAVRWFALVPALMLFQPVHAEQDYPSKPIRVVLPFPMGGNMDTITRIFAQRLQEAWGARIVMEPRPGAGGIIATELAAKAPADGYTLLMVTVGHAVNPSLYSKLPYDTTGDLTGVGFVAMSPNVLVVHPSMPVKSVRALIELAKARPNELMYGTGGVATTAHVAAGMLASLSAIQMMHVPYKGSSPAVQDLVAGRIHLMLDQVSSSIKWIQQGRLRPLAVTPAKRTPLLPEVPTLAESGVPAYDFTAWYLYLAPAKTPAPTLARLNGELQKAAADPEFRARIARVGADHGPSMGPAETSEFIRREIERWAKIVKDANIRIE